MPDFRAFKNKTMQYFAYIELDDVTKNTEKWITKLEVLRRDIQTIDVQIDNSEMCTDIISNLPE